MTAGVATTTERTFVGFTGPQASRLTDASRAQLDAWAQAGVITPGPTYDFDDLVAVRIVVALLDAGLSLSRIRPALQHVHASGGGVRLVTDGDSVSLCATDADVLAALTRSPLAMVVDVSWFVAATEAAVDAFAAERQGFVESLRVS